MLVFYVHWWLYSGTWECGRCMYANFAYICSYTEKQGIKIFSEQ